MRAPWMILFVVSALLPCTSCSESTVRASEKSRPSIILISLDSVRRDHVGCYGYERNTTPHLDKLAEQSHLIEYAYTTATQTLPANMSLLTGTYPSQHGVVRKETKLPESIPTLAETLSEAGYYTMGFHFPGWLNPSFGFDRGFDVYESHRDAEEAEKNVFAALAERPEGRPFFLLIHLFDAHNSPLTVLGATMYNPPSPFDRIFDVDARRTARRADIEKLWKQDGALATPEEHDAIVSLYDGAVRYVDFKIGQWVERWSDEGWFDGTLTIVTADHGEGLRQHGGVYKGHGDVYQEGLAVPLLIRFPYGRYGDERFEKPVSHVDLVPTLLHWIGLVPPIEYPGVSILHGREADSLIISECVKANSYLRWPHKAIEAQDGSSMLFDLENDPAELKNLLQGRQGKASRVIFDEIVEQVRAERARWSAGAELEAETDTRAPGDSSSAVSPAVSPGTTTED